MKQTMKIHEALSWASSFLQTHNREVPIAEILLLHHLGMTKVQLLSSLRDEVPLEKLQAFKLDVEKHAETGVPVQHLTGVETFYGRTFHVTKDVLIPRQETEELIVGVLDYIEQNALGNRVIDIGTGSGIIGITLKLERPGLEVLASDLSGDALRIARKNAIELGAEVAFLEGDFLQPLIESGEKVDVIVSNPPYIPLEDEPALSDTVKNYDPHLALFADENGLAAYIKIIAQAKEVLQLPGLIAFEIGHQQGEAVSNLVKDAFPTSQVEVRKDINQKNRMVFAVIG